MKFSYFVLMALLFAPVFAQSNEPPEGFYFSMGFHTPPMSGKSNPDSEGRVFLVGEISPLAATEFGVANSKFGLSETREGGNAPIAMNLNDLDFNIGFKRLSSKVGLNDRRIGLRIEGGVKWLRTNLGIPTPIGEGLEVAPMFIEELFEELEIKMNGRASMLGVRGGVFVDWHLTNSDHFVYLGTSLGLVNLGLEYTIHAPDPLLSAFSTEDSGLTSMLQYDAGMGFQLGKRLGLKVGYEFSKFKGAGLVTPFSLALGKVDVTPTNRHTVKISLLHWFRRR